MNKKPSESLIQRMQQLVIDLNKTDPERQDETCLLMIEAQSISDALAQEEKEAKSNDKFRAFDIFDSQVILYSKDWYEKTDTISDLKTLISVCCGMDTKYIKDLDVLQQVAGTLHKIWAIKPADNWDTGILYKDTWLEGFWTPKASITLKEHIESFLRVIHMKQIDNYPRLPCPDAKYLPLSKDRSLTRWDEMDKDFEQTLARLTSEK
ncbi:MAG: hypothetical protein RL662_2375 [Bacteroidota bacterium]|jgi:hypothetical protein